MNTFLALALVCLMLVTGSGTAAAQDTHAGVAFKLSTLGVGVDLAVPVGEKVNVRGGGSAPSASVTTSTTTASISPPS